MRRTEESRTDIASTTIGIRRLILAWLPIYPTDLVAYKIKIYIKTLVLFLNQMLDSRAGKSRGYNH